MQTLILLIAGFSFACDVRDFVVQQRPKEAARIAEYRRLGGHVSTTVVVYDPVLYLIDEYLFNLAGIRIIRTDPLVVGVDLGSTSCGDTDLAQLRQFPEIKHLDLSNCPDISDAGLACLKDLEQLEELDLMGDSQITNAGLAHLRGLARLRSLDLWEVPIDDTGTAYLKNLTGLEELCLRGTEINDASLVHLQGLVCLRDLDLSKTEITDAGLERLAGLIQLEELRLYDNAPRVTEAGIEKLKKSLPNTRILRESTRRRRNGNPTEWNREEGQADSL